MRAQVLLRKVHYWLSAVIAVPILFVVCSGLLLQIKKDVHWIQPHEYSGSGAPPQISFEKILEVCNTVPEIEVRGWDDVHRLDFRPDQSLLKVSTHAGWEVQIDPADGRVLQVAVRRSDLIESLHDGSWFGGIVKRVVFLPAGVLLAVLWATGVYLFLLPILRRRRKTKPS